MRLEHTTVKWPTGRSYQRYSAAFLSFDSHNRLLTSPFEWSQAFDRALKDVVKTLPSRPSSESADEVVSPFYSVYVSFDRLTVNRTITALLSEHLENFHVTPEHSDPPI
jgi:hypothetical protein